MKHLSDDDYAVPDPGPRTDAAAPTRQTVNLYPGVKKVRRPLGIGRGSIFYQPERVERRGDRVVKKAAYWRAVYRVSPGVRRSKSCKNERDAREWLAREQRISATHAEQSITAGEWFDIWLATVKAADKRKRTLEAYSGSVRQVLRPALGAVRLDRLPERAQEALDAGRKRGLSPRTLTSHRHLN